MHWAKAQLPARHRSPEGPSPQYASQQLHQHRWALHENKRAHQYELAHVAPQPHGIQNQVVPPALARILYFTEHRIRCFGAVDKLYWACRRTRLPIPAGAPGLRSGLHLPAPLQPGCGQPLPPRAPPRAPHHPPGIPRQGKGSGAARDGEGRGSTGPGARAPTSPCEARRWPAAAWTFCRRPRRRRRWGPPARPRPPSASRRWTGSWRSCCPPTAAAAAAAAGGAPTAAAADAPRPGSPRRAPRRLREAAEAAAAGPAAAGPSCSHWAGWRWSCCPRACAAESSSSGRAGERRGCGGRLNEGSEPGGRAAGAAAGSAIRSRARSPPHCRPGRGGAAFTSAAAARAPPPLPPASRGQQRAARVQRRCGAERRPPGAAAATLRSGAGAPARLLPGWVYPGAEPASDSGCS